MGRKRIHGKDLPKGWAFNHGAYYYRVPKGQESKFQGKQWYRLGATESEAYNTWTEICEVGGNIVLMDDLFDKYLMIHTPTVRPKTQKHQRRAIKNLRPVFGQVAVKDFESPWAFQYYEKRLDKSGIGAANTDMKTLSHCFTKAIEWGILKNADHPLRGLRIKKADPVRDRYIEDWELIEALTVAKPWLRLYIIFKLITGMDKSTILSIKLGDITEEGIYSARIKTKGKQRIYEWNDQLRQVVRGIQALRGPVSSIWLFCTNNGQPYLKEDGNTSGFDSTWRRFMGKALKETKLQKRFTEHDLRAKAASDSESLEFAQKLLGHAKPDITDKVYRRKIETVKTRTVKLKDH